MVSGRLGAGQCARRCPGFRQSERGGCPGTGQPDRTRHIAVGPATSILSRNSWIASLARSPARTQEPLVSPELSNALAWACRSSSWTSSASIPTRFRHRSGRPRRRSSYTTGSEARRSIRRPRHGRERSQGDQSSFVPDMGGAATHFRCLRDRACTGYGGAHASTGTYPGMFLPPPSIAASGGVLPIGPDRSLGADDLDASARALAAPNLPVSKSTGAPYFPPPAQPTISGAQWREIGTEVGSVVAPDLTNYLTKTIPPPIYPSTPGKMIGLTDNPYAAGALGDAVQLAAICCQSLVRRLRPGSGGFATTLPRRLRPERRPSQPSSLGELVKRPSVFLRMHQSRASTSLSPEPRDFRIDLQTKL